LELPCLERPLKTLISDRLTAMHFVERMPPSEKKAKPMKRLQFAARQVGKWKKKRNLILVQGLWNRFMP
jgi:hypothetical protein